MTGKTALTVREELPAVNFNTDGKNSTAVTRKDELYCFTADSYSEVWKLEQKKWVVEE